MSLGITVEFVNRSGDANNSQVVIFEGVEATPQCALRFHNNSGKTQTFVCYQPYGDGVTGTAVAWIATPVAAQVQATFKWRVNYQLLWTEATNLAPGMHVVASEMVAAMFESSNLINLGYADDALHFYGQGPGPAPDTFTIAVDPNVPSDTASIGLAMSGAPIHYFPATPATAITFVTLLNYWVTTADVTPGEVIDLSHVLTEKAQVVFPTGVTEMTVTLDADGNWTAEPGLV